MGTFHIAPWPGECNSTRWYNKHNKGEKHTKVWLPAQRPKKHPSGELMVNLLESRYQKSPSITGIFIKHLAMQLPNAAKRSRTY